MTDNKLEQAARQALEALECLIWAATERDKKNRIRQFDEFVDRAKNSVIELRTNLNLENEMDDQQRNVMHVAWEALHEVVNLLDHRVDDIAEMWCYGIGDCIDTSKQAKEAMTVLREALDNPEERGTSRYKGWVEVVEQDKPLYRKVLREMLDAHKQAEQEPVAWIKLNEDGVYIEDVTGFPVYAAPVQQVDLTDDEIERALDAAKVPELPDGYKSVDLEIARAVIAADREKNHA